MAERSTLTLESRLVARTVVDPRSGCWRYQGCHDRDGYAYIWFDGKRVGVHRASFELYIDDLVAGMHIDHVRRRGCRHRDCWNPAHLEQVTPGENTRRAHEYVAPGMALRVVEDFCGRELWLDVPQAYAGAS